MPYAKSSLEVIEQCEAALKLISACRAADGTKCAPNDKDLIKVKEALYAVAEYKHLRNLDTEVKWPDFKTYVIKFENREDFHKALGFNHLADDIGHSDMILSYSEVYHRDRFFFWLRDVEGFKAISCET